MYNIMFIFSIIFIIVKHPLSLGLILFMQTILISLTMGFFNSNYWYSYIMFLIMVGGMLILFMYMISILPNKTFKYSNLFFIFTFLSMLMLNNNLNLNNKMNNYILFSYNMNLSMNKYFNFPNNMIILMMIIYLLLSLIMITKINYNQKGPIRQKF